MRRKSGVVTAFVHDVDTQHGQVIVEYRDIEEGLLSPWAPVAAAMSGKGRGALFMPEKGDEVLVAFQDGVFEHPFIVGFLWNGEHVSPETEPHHRVIVTPGDNQLRFEDKPNDTRVILKSAGQRSVTLEDTPLAPHIEIKSGQHRIVLDDTPAGPMVEITAGTAVGVTITMRTLPQPSLTIQIGAGTTLSIDSTGASLATAGVANITCATANVKADASVNLTAPVLNVNAALANFSGTLAAARVVAQTVMSPFYTPGFGNRI